VLNTAPFSFFNLIGADPPMCILGIDNKADGTAKDTLHNVTAVGATGELTISLVDRPTIERAVLCATDLPRDVSEMGRFGLSPAKSMVVGVPSVAECKVALECREAKAMVFGNNNVVLARIVAVSAAEGVVSEKGRVDYSKFMPVGRFKSPGGYCDLQPFEIKWPNSKGES
jgi:flavin reductase (DIM6/NTAB) family NADH-FMN oxidoreductase RutF